MSPEQLTQLAYKYPACTLCTHCVKRDHVVFQITPKVGTREFCSLHNRPVAYDYWLDAKGKVWVQGTKFCDDFHYEWVEKVPSWMGTRT